jgi:hypothetical protein
VALLAAKLARAAGYGPEDVIRVGEAARLHGLGRLAGTVFPAPDPLSDKGLAVRREEAAICARMVVGVLDDEQADWIARQYEPRERGPDAQPRGDELLALADAWDTLTAVGLLAPAEALAALQRLAGERIGARALAALGDLHRAGELSPGGETVSDPS